jgi:hypothetical protein
MQLFPVPLFRNLRIIALAALLFGAITKPAVAANAFAKGDLVRLKRGEMLMFKGDDFMAAAKGQEFTVLTSDPRVSLVYVAFYKKAGELIALTLPTDSIEPLTAAGWNALLRGVECFRDQRFDDSRKFLARAMEDNEHRPLASLLSNRISGATTTGVAARSAAPDRAATARQAFIRTLLGLRDTAEQLAQQGQVTLASTLEEGTDRLGAQALGTAADVPPSKTNREDLAARAATANRALACFRQAIALRRLTEASQVIQEGLKADASRPDLKVAHTRVQKEISEADEHCQNADRMRRSGAKGVIHALTALEMGLKLCADHPQLLTLKKEMQSAFEERTAPPITTSFLKAAGPEVSAKTLEEGRRLYTSRCVECHDLELLDSRSMNAWRGIVGDMARRAKIDGAQQSRIVEYLAAAQRGLDAAQ